MLINYYFKEDKMKDILAGIGVILGIAVTWAVFIAFTTIIIKFVWYM